jgi:hypothetical protein
MDNLPCILVKRIYSEHDSRYQVFSILVTFKHNLSLEEWKQSKAKQSKTHSMQCNARKQARRFIMRALQPLFFLCKHDSENFLK